MKIAIIGSRGIPNAYGGFEQFAEYLSVGLSEAGHSVSVYNSSQHPYKEKKFKSVNIIHCYDPEHKLGTAGQFIYDFNCIKDSRKRDFDVLLILGYTSSSIWSWYYPKDPERFTNMDGLEWKRSKYSSSVKRFLEYAEHLGAKHGGHLVADSPGIKKYLEEKYNLNSTYIPYGASVFENPKKEVLNEYKLTPFSYNMLVARLEPENNIDTILTGVAQLKETKKMLVVGNTNNDFGSQMKQKHENENIIFTEGIYNQEHLNNLRYYSNIYFHGHTVGGTNPSLLEAMASGALIIAHDNQFNKHILEEDAFYFRNSEDIANLLSQDISKKDFEHYIQNNYKKIRTKYSWPVIINQYESLFQKYV